MGKIPGGYYIKARKIQESSIMQSPPHVREIWDWLIMEANHKTRRVGGKNIQRGQLIRSTKDIRNGLKWKVGFRTEYYTLTQCENAMKALRNAGMIATQRTTRGMIITVLNYETYQDPKNYDSRTDSRNDGRTSAGHVPDDKQECKNGRMQAVVGEPPAAAEFNKIMHKSWNRKISSDDEYEILVELFKTVGSIDWIKKGFRSSVKHNVKKLSYVCKTSVKIKTDAEIRARELKNKKEKAELDAVLAGADTLAGLAASFEAELREKRKKENQL